MTVAYINPAVATMVDTLSTAFGIGVQPGKPLLKRTEIPLGDVTALMEIVSDHFHASMAISFNEQSLLSFTQLLLNETYLEMNDIVTHIAGDVAVMVGGNIKRRFVGMGHQVTLKHPQILSGFQTRVAHPLVGPKIVFPLNTEDGIVFLEICLRVGGLGENTVRQNGVAA